MTHKVWLDNEYQQFIEALEMSTVDNFKSHPMVKRMLGEVDPHLYPPYIGPELPILQKIDRIGGTIPGQMGRFVYYAKMVLAQNPNHIVEIGGGCGQFYATLRALGYMGKYYIYDLPEVQKFQWLYLHKVRYAAAMDHEVIVLLDSLPFQGAYDFCVSLYALGEFDDETKGWYVENVVKKCPHGLVVFNPHSGASDEITWDCKVEPENPLTAPNNKLCTW